MKIGEKIIKPAMNSSCRGGKRCRIKLVKRLEDDLFINKDQSEGKEKNEQEKCKNISRNKMEERTNLLTNYYEGEYDSLKAASSEIVIENVDDDDEIVVTYSNITSDHAQDTIEEGFGQRMEVSQEMEKLRRYLSDPSVNTNDQGKFGNTALIRAVQTNDKAIVRTLLRCPRVDVNLADYNGYTPLIWAADMCSVTMVKLLLARRDIRVNMRDNNGYTALMWGLENNRVVRKLLRHKDIDVNIQDDDGHTALIWAADNGHVDVVRTLLGVTNIDPNLQSIEGFTALICAAGQGYERIVRYLLENAETDAGIKDKDGYTAMVAAANSGYYNIASTVKHHLYPVQTD